MSDYEGQDAVFFDEEGDRWFQRNSHALLAGQQGDPVLTALVGLLDPAPSSVLEVGASNGFRLAAIHEEHGSRCVAVEPSVEAIKNGKSVFSQVEFRRGMASDIPLQRKEKFDLVIVSFVLHWVDRSSLDQAVGSISNCVRDGGLLVVTDFLPEEPTCNPYHHRDDETRTYKQDYSRCFTSLNIYESVKTVITYHGDHGEGRSDADRRVATTVLQKNLRGLYRIGV